MGNRPHFLDEVSPPAVLRATAAPSAEPEAALRTGPVLLDAGPDAAAVLQATWRPQALAGPLAPAVGVPWIALGLAVVIIGFAVLSAVAFVLDMAKRSLWLGVAAGLMLGLSLGLIGYRLGIEWLSYRQLQTVDRTRAALSGRNGSIETVRTAALGWLEQVDTTLAGVDDVVRAIRTAPTLIELQAILRNRAADPLREAAKGLGRRAALQGASLVAISPHASWDGLIAGVRAVLVIRAVARLFGLRPGPTVTIALVRKVVWTAAGTAAIEVVSQNLADHLLNSMPGVKHLAATVPGSGAAALRLYRLASIAAEACCPVVG